MSFDWFSMYTYFFDFELFKSYNFDLTNLQQNKKGIRKKNIKLLYCYRQNLLIINIQLT